MTDSYRYAFAQYVREEFSRRAYAAGTQSYDDLLYHVAKPLEEPGSSLQAASQNAIRPHLSMNFKTPTKCSGISFTASLPEVLTTFTSLVTPSRPFTDFAVPTSTYLKRDTADTQYTMDRNFRSDAIYIDAMNHLLRLGRYLRRRFHRLRQRQIQKARCTSACSGSTMT